MFDLCYSNGANLNILNKQNLSPLTLAAKLRRVNVSKVLTFQTTYEVIRVVDFNLHKIYLFLQKC